MLFLYWEIGDTILQQQKIEGWGTKVIDRLAIDLKTEFPDMKEFSVRNIKYIRAFAEAYPEFVQQPVAQIPEANNQSVTVVQHPVARLPWGHLLVLLDKTKTNEKEISL